MGTATDNLRQNNRQGNFTRYVWGVLMFNILVILWGAWVRISGSGDGCGSHWPLCNGEALPISPSTQTLIELSHRLTSALAGLLTLGLVAWAFWAFPAKHPARFGAVWSFIFILIEGILGAGLVLLGLTGEDKSLARGISLPLHFANTMLLLGTFAYTAVVAHSPRRPSLHGWGRAAGMAWFAVLGTISLGMLGAFAALGNTLFPSASLAEGIRADFSLDASFFIQLRILHPILAVIMAVVLFNLPRWLPTGHTPAQQAGIAHWGHYVRVILGIQMLAGMLNWMLLAPTWLQISHLLLACVLWLALVLLLSYALDRQALPTPTPPGGEYASS